MGSSNQSVSRSTVHKTKRCHRSLVCSAPFYRQQLQANGSQVQRHRATRWGALTDHLGETRSRGLQSPAIDRATATRLFKAPLTCLLFPFRPAAVPGPWKPSPGTQSQLLTDSRPSCLAVACADFQTAQAEQESDCLHLPPRSEISLPGPTLSTRTSSLTEGLQRVGAAACKGCSLCWTAVEHSPWALLLSHSREDVHDEF